MNATEPEITLTSTTETAEEMAQAFDGGEVVEEAQPGQSPTRPTAKPDQPGAPKILRDWRDGNVPVGVQRRIDTLTARWKAAEDKLARLEGRAPTEFQDSERQPSPAAATPRNGESSESHTHAEDPHHETRIQQGRARYRDWDAVFERARAHNIQVPEVAIQAARRLPNSADIFYALAKNPALCAELLTAGPEGAVAKVREIGLALHIPHLAAQQPGHREFHRSLTQAMRNESAQVKAHQFQIPAALAQAVHAALIFQDNGAETYLYLAKHPELAAHFDHTNPQKAYGQIVRIAAELATGRPAPRPAISRAPAPITPVKGSHTAPTSLANLSTDDFIRRRESDTRRNRRR